VETVQTYILFLLSTALPLPVEQGLSLRLLHIILNWVGFSTGRSLWRHHSSICSRLPLFFRYLPVQHSSIAFYQGRRYL